MTGPRCFLVILLAFATSACAPAVRQCAKDTVFVTVSLDDTAATATQLVVDVAIGSAAAMRTTLDHVAGTRSGGIQIEFPHGYPTGQTVTITVTANAGSALLATAAKTFTADGSCVGIALALAASVPADLAVADAPSPDLVGVDAPTPDLAGTTADLFESLDLSPVVDFTIVDLTGADLTCVPVAEDCFNGVDDDCDGNVDCADSDCVGGGTPKAECVTDPGAGFSLGVRTSAACDANYPTSNPIVSIVAPASCNLNSCSCPSTLAGYCMADLIDYGSENGCSCSGGGCTHHQYDSRSGCVTETPPVGSNHYHYINPPQWLTDTFCSPTGGMATKNNATLANEAICSRPSFGGGCGIGKLCVPKAVNHCAVKAGPGTCPSGFNSVATSFFKSVDDSGTCSCGCGLTSGTCDTTDFTMWKNDTTNCSVGPTPVPSTCGNSAMSLYNQFKVGAPTAAGSCSVKTNLSQATAGVTPQLVCCTP